MSTQNLQHTNNFQPDDVAPAYERINGTGILGSAVLALAFAAITFLMSPEKSNGTALIIFMVLVLGNYSRKALQPAGKVLHSSDDRKTLMGYVGLGVLFFALVSWSNSLVTSALLALLVSVAAGVAGYLLARYLLPSIRRIPQDISEPVR